MKKKTKRKISIFVFTFLFLTLTSNILFLTYNILVEQNYSLYFLITSIIISLIPAVILSHLSNAHYKKIINFKSDTSALLIAVPIISLVLLISSFLFITYKNNKLFKENELIFENFEKYYNFENGMSYRLDVDTKRLNYMDDYKLKSIKPIYYYDLKEEEIKVYDLSGKFLLVNGNDHYLTNSLEVTSELYKVNESVVSTFETYFILDNKDSKKVNDEYKSRQEESYLYLYKKYNDILYTQEKMYDLRIQVLNSFEASQLAVYNKRDIEIPIEGKVYKIEYTFDEKFEIIYTKNEK